MRIVTLSWHAQHRPMITRAFLSMPAYPRRHAKIGNRP